MSCGVDGDGEDRGGFDQLLGCEDAVFRRTSTFKAMTAEEFIYERNENSLHLLVFPNWATKFLLDIAYTGSV